MCGRQGRRSTPLRRFGPMMCFIQVVITYLMGLKNGTSTEPNGGWGIFKEVFVT